MTLKFRACHADELTSKGSSNLDDLGSAEFRRSIFLSPPLAKYWRNGIIKGSGFVSPGSMVWQMSIIASIFFCMAVFMPLGGSETSSPIVIERPVLFHMGQGLEDCCLFDVPANLPTDPNPICFALDESALDEEDLRKFEDTSLVLQDLLQGVMASFRELSSQLLPPRESTRLLPVLPILRC